MDLALRLFLPSQWSELKAKTLLTVKVQNLQIRRELKIVYRKDKHLSPAARAFLEGSQAEIQR
jgi:DNA-binding transcriptional LysR family regulator